MAETSLILRCAAEMDCPKEVVMWNYYDHEHLVGTHYKYYSHARVLAERDDWALVYRKMKMPLLPFYNSGIALQYIDGDTMKTFHKDSIGFLLEMQAKFEDLPGDRSRVSVTYKINAYPFLKIFEPFFQKLFEKWFHGTWVEDAPMRLRRWKVHQLGFRDFYGIDYINKKTQRPDRIEFKKYEFNPPVKSSSGINKAEGVNRPFDRSVELGYHD